MDKLQVFSFIRKGKYELMENHLRSMLVDVRVHGENGDDLHRFITDLHGLGIDLLYANRQNGVLTSPPAAR
ncbi:MAG: hypothetical protein PVH92_07025 [Anaerolineales bacterium]|jgi:hypothetical protein